MSLKVLYVYGHAGRKPQSVQNKIMSQIEYLNEAGVLCDGAFFSIEVSSEEQVAEHIRLIPYEKSQRQFLRHLNQTGIMLERVYEYITANHEKYDLIYLRYPGSHPALLKLARKFGHKLCIEHNSKEGLEIIGLGQNFRPLWKPAGFLGFLAFVIIPLLLECTIGVLVRRNVLFATCVSSDMAQYQKRLSFGRLKCYPIGNGINVEKNPLRRSPVFDGAELDILFLKGSSGNAPWNGLDRLICGMAKYTGPVEIRLHIVGNRVPGEVEIPREIESKVVFTGYLEGEALDKMFDKCHIACGTLGLFRSKQKENATLKVRNYIVRGIPFFYGYTDIDLADKPDAKRWSEELENNGSPVNMQEIIRFAHNALYPGHERQMREFAVSHLDYRVKMRELAALLMKESGV
ncbi:MAG: hypothetical protein ACK5U7_12940 [Bacteroidota bacterium]|jgi:hypothetical protein